MSVSQIQTLPMPTALPLTLPGDGAINLELEEGVLIFRASHSAQERIEDLLDKQKKVALTPDEEIELDRYEEIDAYLSYVNRLIRNLAWTQTGTEELRVA